MDPMIMKFDCMYDLSLAGLLFPLILVEFLCVYRIPIITAILRDLYISVKMLSVLCPPAVLLISAGEPILSISIV